ncbi:MAG: TerC family protein [Dysgonamonadaceae bacterium]|jgi:tellurite resistance protein TerC|nr:TerC family protein [Dysgonamonadaceae bacterium]
MSDEGIWYWVGFITFVIIMLMLDLGVFHKKNHAVKIREAIYWSLFWIGLALLFNVGTYYVLGKEKAFEFFTAYVLEKSLSVDNLFVFILIFSYFQIEPKYQHKILFWGILGALVMRAAFIFAGIALITKFSWIMYVFGIFLLYTGIHMLFEKKEEDFDPNKNLIIRWFKKIMPVTHENPKAKFFVKINGKHYATTFFITLLFLEVSDLIFAVDSIPAVLSVSKDTFIVFTSNIFAILGLRSLYFALSGIMQYFYYLKYALAGILSFIGIKMCINELSHEFGYAFHISNYVSLGVILGLLSISIIFSIIVKKRKESN